MTTEQVFDRLWTMGYTLPDSKLPEFKRAIAILADLFPEEEWSN